jgi:transposase
VPTFGDVTIYLCRDPVDFRLGINGLSTMVEATLKFDPFSRNLFCFVNKRRTQIKVLYWQRSGFCLWLKRLEEEKFKWPVHMAPLKVEIVRPPVLKITEDEFDWLLEGLDLKHLKPHRALEYRSVL